MILCSLLRRIIIVLFVFKYCSNEIITLTNNPNFLDRTSHFSNNSNMLFTYGIASDADPESSDYLFTFILYVLRTYHSRKSNNTVLVFVYNDAYNTHNNNIIWDDRFQKTTAVRALNNILLKQDMRSWEHISVLL